MTIRIYTPQQQRAILERHIKSAAYRTLALTNRKMDDLMRLAVERAMSQEALAAYGDSMFHQSLSELERETWEELADAFNRQAVYEAKEKGYLA